MKTKSVPALIMLLAGFITCIAGIAGHMEIVRFTKMLLIVLIVFYFLGCIVKMILDKNFKEEEKEEETTDGEESEAEGGETEPAEEEEKEEEARKDTA